MKTPPIISTFLALVLALVLVAFLARAGLATDAPDSTAGDAGPVFVDATDILYLESFPVQVQLLVAGTVPTPCHEVAYSVEDLGDRIDVLLWSMSDPDIICVQVLEPFEESIPLGSFETANLPVVLNGEVVGRIVIGSEPSTASLAGSGWSFGMCLDYCVVDLALDGADLVLVGRNGGGDPRPLYEHRGALTEAGVARLDAALAELGDTLLDDVYGCPDCADGGAAHIDIVRDGISQRVEMGFGDPPDVLADVDAISASLIGALETCVADELVTVEADCVAYLR